MPRIQGFNYPRRPQSVIDAFAEAVDRRANGARNVTGGIRKPTDDFEKLLQRINKMPARPRRAPRRAPSRTSKRKVRGKKRTIKRKAPVRKSTKRKKRKVSKGVSLTVGTARERRLCHVQYTAAQKALYIPVNSIGPKDTMLMMVAQSLLLHYMHRVGDYRANVTMVPTGELSSEVTADGYQVATWSQMTFHFAALGSGTADVSSFKVWAYFQGGTFAMQTLEMMTHTVKTGLLTQIQAGRRLSGVSVFRGQTFNSSKQPTEHIAILQDISAGRNVLEFTCKSAIKMQNITPADVTHSDAQTCGHDNALNINRNPLDGLVYKFRNQVPKFKMQYLISKPAGIRNILDDITDCYSSHKAGIAPINLVAYGDEWGAPPPAPSTIFSNLSGKSPISIGPGAHKTLGMSESFKGPVNSFFEKYFPIRLSAGNAFEVPPGGNCMIIGLKPKYRNGTQQPIKVEAEIDHTYAARVSRAKLTPLPMNTQIP